MLQLHPAWHHLALPCLGAHNIPKGGALGPWVPFSVGTGTWSGSAVPVAAPAAAGGRVCLSRGFPLVLASGAGTGAAGTAGVAAPGLTCDMSGLASTFPAGTAAVAAVLPGR